MIETPARSAPLLQDFARSPRSFEVIALGRRMI